MIETISRSEKFSDAGELVYEFGEEFLVVCPRCASQAKVSRIETSTETLKDNLFASRRLVCLFCIYRDDWSGGEIAVGGNFDWYFRRPLWLQIECCGGETLWAYNARHLSFIENYVAAKLRERTPNINKSMASRLPLWMKSAKNRGEVLKAIGKLKEKLNGKS